MTDIFADIRKSSENLEQARRNHRKVLDDVEAIVKPLWEEYLKEFGALAERADKEGIPWRHHMPEERHGWGNAGLQWIGPDPEFIAGSGMMRITTMDFFRGERSENDVSIPGRFLGENGMELIRTEAYMLHAELDAAIAARDQRDAQANEEFERNEFERLSLRFGGK